MTHCFYDDNAVFQDGYCAKHWHDIFDGMTNKQRMHAKRDLRAARHRLSQQGQQELQQKSVDTHNKRDTMLDKGTQA